MMLPDAGSSRTISKSSDIYPLTFGARPFNIPIITPIPEPTLTIPPLVVGRTLWCAYPRIRPVARILCLLVGADRATVVVQYVNAHCYPCS